MALKNKWTNHEQKERHLPGACMIVIFQKCVPSQIEDAVAASSSNPISFDQEWKHSAAFGLETSQPELVDIYYG
jgi:hypothetical protein